MEPKRFNHFNCSDISFSAFVNVIKADKTMTIFNHKPSSENCHFVRYNLKSDIDKASIVYDTKAKILTITASGNLFDHLNNIYYKTSMGLIKGGSEKQENVQIKTIETPDKKIENKKHTASKEVKNKGEVSRAGEANKNEKSKNINPKNLSEPKQNKKRNTVNPKEERSKEKSEKPNTLVEGKTKAKQSRSGTEQETLQYKNGYSVKNITLEKMNLLIKRIRSTGAGIRLMGVSDKGKTGEIKSYTIEDENRQKAILRFLPAKQVVQLQGKRSSLFSEVQVILNDNADFVTAVNSHRELTGEQRRVREVERQLKKALPNAYPFLSEQARIDLSIGLMDIGNNEVKLSDYSVLLVPPYRGLERLILDLQRAKGIDVKMIGQAFERPEGAYELKVGYKKKIDSIVYAEVMSSLYTEYFEKRNFYAHADNSTESISRLIDDKTVAKEIFEKLLKLIDYNCKKLAEIGFVMKNNRG